MLLLGPSDFCDRRIEEKNWGDNWPVKMEPVVKHGIWQD